MAACDDGKQPACRQGPLSELRGRNLTEVRYHRRSRYDVPKGGNVRFDQCGMTCPADLVVAKSLGAQNEHSGVSS
jgi:hypothetical protein